MYPNYTHSRLSKNRWHTSDKWTRNSAPIFTFILRQASREHQKSKQIRLSGKVSNISPFNQFTRFLEFFSFDVKFCNKFLLNAIRPQSKSQFITFFSSQASSNRWTFYGNFFCLFNCVCSIAITKSVQLSPGRRWLKSKFPSSLLFIIVSHRGKAKFQRRKPFICSGTGATFHWIDENCCDEKKKFARIQTGKIKNWFDSAPSTSVIP